MKRKDAKTYPMIPATVISTPKALRSVTALPLTTHPMPTMLTVFRWPTTVLVTGPELFTIKNWLILISAAKQPESKIDSQREVGTAERTGTWSMKGTAKRRRKAEMGAWLKRSCEEDIESLEW